MNRALNKLVIIGSGPAAHTAAIYASRANMKPILYEGFMAGNVAAGGQLTTTTDVENFPGFPLGISGPQLMENMREQSLRFGTEIKTETISRLNLSVRPFQIWSEEDEKNINPTLSADCIVIATGATAKRMDIPGETKYWQKGISACAICDGAAPIFKNKVVAVIGGGDSACEEAMFLTKYASQVVMIVRRNQLRASKVMQERVMKNEKVQIMWNMIPTKAFGDEKFLKGLELQNTVTSEKSSIQVNGLFYAIGHVPNTSFLFDKLTGKPQLDLDDAGYIKTKPGTCFTSVEGVYAAGDVQDKKYRQAVTAAGSGCMAALEAEKYLENQN